MTFSGVFAIGLSGVNAFNDSLQAVSSNIANSQTAGYKRVETDFSELVTQNAPELNEAIGTGVAGTGVAATNSQRITEQGSITRTGTQTNLAIAGDGFFVVSNRADADPASNPFVFTRAGGFSADSAGNLVNAAGYFLRGAPLDASGAAPSLGSLNNLETVNINRNPPLAAGEASLGDLTGIAFDDDGRLIGTYANGQTRALYEIPLAVFTNPDALEEAADTTFQSTNDAGSLSLLRPGQNRAGSLEASAIENSTVDIGQEFSTLIATQRAYSSNARVISVADELWRTLTDTAV